MRWYIKIHKRFARSRKTLDDYHLNTQQRFVSSYPAVAATAHRCRRRQQLKCCKKDTERWLLSESKKKEQQQYYDLWWFLLSQFANRALARALFFTCIWNLCCRCSCALSLSMCKMLLKNDIISKWYSENRFGMVFKIRHTTEWNP